MSKFYGVAHGFQRGIFTEWNEAKKQIDKFPQPVYKKFGTDEEAKKYLDERKAKKIESSFPEPTHDTYYAVARGHTVGVFTDYSVVKDHIKNYPQPLHKKFTKLDDAIAYFNKYFHGKEGEKSEKSGEKSEKKSEKAEKSGEKRKADKEESVEKKKKKK